MSGVRIGLFLLKEDPVLGDELRQRIFDITGVMFEPPAAPAPSVPPEVPAPGLPPAEPPAAEPPAAEPPPSQPGPGDGITMHTRYGVPPQQLTDAIRKYWPASEWVNAAEVAYGESGWRNTAINDTVSTRGPCGTRYYIANLGIWAQTELSVGYFQINICAHGGSVQQWTDPDANAQKAAQLYHSSGNKYTPWVITAGRLGLPV